MIESKDVADGTQRGLGLVMAASPQAMLAVDRAHAICMGNQIASHIFGYDLESLLGLSIGDLISGRDRHAFLARLSAAKHQADPQSSSQLLGFRPLLGLGRTGSVIPLEIGLSIIEISDDDRIIVLTVNDVRERRAAEDRIRVSEERFRRLTALSTDFFWETDDQLRFSFVSQRDFSESVRKLRDRFLGRRFWEIDGVRPVSFTWQEFQSLTREHRPFRLQTYSATLDDGETRHYTVSGEPMFDPGGHFIGYRGVAADTTDAESARQEALERERAHVKALREELERLRGGADNWSRLPVGEALYGTRAISSSSPEEFDKLLVRGALFESILEYTQDFVTLISRDGELLFRGKRVAELYPDNTNVEDSFEVVVEQDREAVRTIFKQLLARGGTRYLQYRAKIPSGEVRYMDAIGTAIPDDRHKVAAVLLIARDVTDTVQARAREEQSQRLEAIGQLTGGLAHDFNNLLGIVIGCLDDMDAMLPDDATLRRRQRIAMEAAQRGAQITRSLLTVARRQSLELKLHDLNALVTDLLPLLRSSIGPTPQLQTDLADTGLMVMVDADAVSNVLINLVINSRDACLGLGGEHHVVIRTLRQKVGSGEDRDLEPGWYAVLQVQDDGSGITTEVRERAFDPFFTTKKSGDGTGLGLSMVYGYARQMHGTARIEGAPGSGTTVSVLLPLPSEDSGSAGKRSDESASTHDQEPSPGDQRESTDETGAALEHTAAPRVLVVDDEEGLCELGCAWMQALGLTAVGAGNADEALEILATQSFDVLFTDIVMPGSMNGVELAKRVKERYPQVRVILTSGNAGVLSAQGVELPGLLVEKPYRKPELANALRQVGVEPPKAVGRR